MLTLLDYASRVTRPAPPEWQPEAIEQLLERLPDLDKTQIFGWSMTLWMYGGFGQPRLAEAVEDLDRLAAALQDVGPTAQAILLHRTSLEDIGELIEMIELLARQVQSQVRTGPCKDVEQALARCVAQAYSELTGRLPPKSDPYTFRKTETAYHALVRDVFKLAGLSGWQSHALPAARYAHAEAHRMEELVIAEA